MKESFKQLNDKATLLIYNWEQKQKLRASLPPPFAGGECIKYESRMILRLRPKNKPL